MAEEASDAVVEPQVLSLELMKPALKGLARTVDGTGFALTHLEIQGKNIGDISALALYTHIRYLDLSTNEITDLKPLQGLDHLLSVNLSKNRIASLELPALQFLQVPHPIRTRFALPRPATRKERQPRLPVPYPLPVYHVCRLRYVHD